LSQRPREPVERVHFHLYTRDLARIDALFKHRMSRAQAVRELLRRMLDRIEAKGKIRVQPLQVPNDLELPPLPEVEDELDKLLGAEA